MNQISLVHPAETTQLAMLCMLQLRVSCRMNDMDKYTRCDKNYASESKLSSFDAA